MRGALGSPGRYRAGRCDAHVLPEGRAAEGLRARRLVLLADLEGWVIDQANAWDRIQTNRGVFVRQVSGFVKA